MRFFRGLLMLLVVECALLALAGVSVLWIIEVWQSAEMRFIGFCLAIGPFGWVVWKCHEWLFENFDMGV